MTQTHAINLLAARAAALAPLQPLEKFVREYVERAGGVWDEVEPQVYDLLVGNDDPVRITFDPEALPEHPSAQLAGAGSPLIDRLLDDARRRGGHSVFYAGGLNTHPHDLPGRLRRAFTTPPDVTPVPRSARLCFFPQAAYRFVATFASDRKEQALLEVTLDLHAGHEVRHLRRMLGEAQLTARPIEPLPEARHLSLQEGFALACQQVVRSLSPLANQRRRELTEHTGRQIERLERYYTRMLEELEQQPRRSTADPAEAAARKQARVDAIHRERRLRAAELRHKSVLRATLSLVGVQVIHLPKLLVRFDLVRERGTDRPLEAVFDLLTESFEPIQSRPGGPPTFDLTASAR